MWSLRQTDLAAQAGRLVGATRGLVGLIVDVSVGLLMGESGVGGTGELEGETARATGFMAVGAVSLIELSRRSRK